MANRQETEADASMKLVLKLQLEDMQSMQSAGFNGDSVTAQRLFIDELRQYKFAHLFDEELAELCEAVEKRLDETVPVPMRAATPTLTPPQTPRLTAAKPVQEAEVDIPAFEEEPLFKCEACEAELTIDGIWQAQCQHHYCVYCVQEWFTRAMIDREMYPPKCCGTAFPWDDVKDELPEGFVMEFGGMREELETKMPMYCHVRKCGRFISKNDSVRDTAVCQKCDAATCTHCKGAAHGEGDCAEDSTIKETMALAKKSGWKACPGCKSVIQRTTGCNHMSCQLWEGEQQLLDPEYRGQAQAAPVVQHRCQHDGGWIRQRGEHVCDECGDTLYAFIYECRECDRHVDISDQDLRIKRVSKRQGKIER
ncbi:hypothetical protein LTR95_010764 [Oleoguttula sp. CCFEE 5521]